MIGIPSLRGLQAFEAAARSGSFVAASGELGISPAAVSQLIRALEDQVGRKLFHRVNRRSVLTEAGREIFPQLANAFSELRSASRELGGGERRSTLVVSVAPSVAMGWLSTRLPDFVEGYGPVDISLRGEDDPVPFERELVDIRLSYGRFHYLDHVSEELVIDAVYPVCSPKLLARHGPVRTARDLLALPLIHTDWGPAGASFPSWRNWFEKADIQTERSIQRGMTANSSMAALDLAVGGLGVVLGQGMFAAPFVEHGQLVVALDHSLDLSSPYCLTIPHRSAQRPAVVAFKAWFITQCAACVGSPALRRKPDA